MKIPAPKLKKGFILSVEAIVGSDGYTVNDRERLSYCRDANFRSAIEAHYSRFENFPALVAWPKTAVQLSQLVKVAARYQVPLVPYGGGSGVCGGASPLNAGITVDMKRMQRLIRVDENRLFAEAEAGIYGLQLEKELNRKGFTLGHFPSSILVATLGGYLAARSAGQNSNKYGKIEDMVLDLEFVDGRGDLHRTSDVSRKNSGLDLAQAIIGSEGTLGFVTKARIKIYPLPETRLFASFRFPKFEYGAEAIRRIMQQRLFPDVVRLYDELDTTLAFPSDKNETRKTLSTFLKNVPDPLKKIATNVKKGAMGVALRSHRLLNALGPYSPSGSLLIFVFEGERAIATAERDVVASICKDMGATDSGEDPAARWFDHRYGVSFKASKLFCEGAFTDTMEVATTWKNLNSLYRGVREAVSPHALVMTHLSHAYSDGAALYFTFVAPLNGLSRSLKTYDRIWFEALKATQKHDGVISHHHGIGRLKAPFLKKEWGDAREIYAEFKKFFDPHSILNPGVLLPEISAEGSET